MATNITAQLWYSRASLLVAAVVFLVDAFVLPLGIASGVLYVFAFLLAINGPSIRSTFVLSILLSALVGFGYLWSPQTVAIPKGFVIANRALALLVIWVGFALSVIRFQSRSAARTAATLAQSVVDGMPDLLLMLTANHQVNHVFGSDLLCSPLDKSHWTNCRIFDLVPADRRKPFCPRIGEPEKRAFHNSPPLISNFRTGAGTLSGDLSHFVRAKSL